MIPCFSKNNRASRLFSELTAVDPKYVDAGVRVPRRRALYLGALSSGCTNAAQFKTDRMFAPVVASDMEAQGTELMRGYPSASAILYWGAMNSPVVEGTRKLPYFIITDGPFDPDDPSYPVEWKTRRWDANYFQRQRGIFRNATQVFTLSEWARRKVISLHGLPESQVTRIGWGPMLVEDKPVFELPDGGYFLSVGNQWHCKGMDFVSKAGAELHEKDGRVQTIIVGAPGGVTIPPAKGVVLIPHQLPHEAVRVLIKNARALILASRFDSAGHVTYEALQAGTPVIGSDVAGVAEGIQAPHGGRLIPVGDVQALVQAMGEIWNTPDITAQRKSAYCVYEESGGWTRSAEIISNVVNAAL
jgi:glycosyltransferase involved in cell wall biosynthesis